MNFANELADLYRRDLTRLQQELLAFSDPQDLWRSLPGTTNSAGNLALHLEGNLREFVGRQLGNVAYQRKRDLEFSTRDLPADDLIQRIGELKNLIPMVISKLSTTELEAIFPEQVFHAPITSSQLLMSLLGHLNYHLGQIDYLRRTLTVGTAIQFAGL